MIDISRARKGDILITEEFMFGQTRLLYGPVFLIDNERKEIALKIGEELRSFSAERLWTIPSFIARKAAGQQPKVLISPGTRVLAGFIATLLNGDMSQGDINDVLNEIKKKGIQPTKIQEGLEVLMNL